MKRLIQLLIALIILNSCTSEQQLVNDQANFPISNLVKWSKKVTNFKEQIKQ